MKNLKKMIGLLLAMTMVFAMTMSAFAADITITGGATDSTYSAWRLLNATDGGNGKFAYTVNETYEDVLTTVLSEVQAGNENVTTDVVKYLNDNKDNANLIRQFADAVYAKVKSMTPDATASDNTFTGVGQGYYLIAETATGNVADTLSLVMLDTAGNDNVNVATKEDVPELVKKVKETNDSTGVTSDWQDGADYDIGDRVPFQLTGTVSAKYDSYKTYYYAFHDKMSAGLEFMAETVKVYVDGKLVENTDTKVYYTVKTSDLTQSGCTFEVVFNNLKDIATVTANSNITVEFEAKLTGDNVVVGTPGNPNEAKLEYNNNPYYEGDGKPDKTGETPWDKVVVFTYVLNANKVDGQGNALEGAGFTLYKYDKETEAYVAVGDEITGVTTFTFNGLDAGKYKLVETTVPAGYNKADDIEFTIEATYDTDKADPKLTGLVVKDASGNVISEGEELVFGTVVTDGSVNTDIENLTGAELPETGGIGTTMFYVIGAILVVGAAVVMITRKRMSR